MTIKIDRPPEVGEYDEGMQTLLQIVWGDGFLSPGGPEEVARMLEGSDIRGCDVPSRCKQKGNSMFRGGNGISKRRIHDYDAARGGRRDVDVVDTDAGAADHLELFGGADHFLVGLRRGAHGQAVVIADDSHEIGLLEADAYIHLHAAGAKDVEGFRAQLIGN